MAKKETKPATTSTVEITPDNVMDQVRNKNLQNEESVKKALEDIEKEEDEKKREEAKRAIKKFQYKNLRALIELRRRRAEDKVTKEYLTATKVTLDEYLSGKITISEAEEKDIKDTRAKAEGFNKVDTTFGKEIKELKNAYPGYWSWDWDNTTF